MDNCCQAKSQEIGQNNGAFGRVLWVVFALNSAMFVVEFGAGFVGQSTALLADSVDMFGDATVYGLSLLALHKTVRWKAGAALAKSLLMGCFALLVLADVAMKIAAGTVPAAQVMGVFGGMALVANLACALLLWRFRSGEINMRSTWLCSRNDVLANLGVLLAAALVVFSKSAWPDIIVGLLIAGLFIQSAVGIFREALHQIIARPQIA